MSMTGLAHEGALGPLRFELETAAAAATNKTRDHYKYLLLLSWADIAACWEGEQCPPTV